MEHFLDAFAALAAHQGAVLRREALAMGVDDRALRRAVRRGSLHRLRQGAYVPQRMWELASPSDRLVHLTRAAMRVSSDAVVASHVSAAAMHGLDLWDVDVSRAHLTRTDGTTGRRERDVTHHDGCTEPSDIVEVEGFRATSPVRSALESASLLDIERGMVAVASGLRRGAFSAEELAERHDAMARWPGTQHLHVVTRLADARSESVGEVRALHLFWRQAVPLPHLQFEVYAGGELVGITDFAWPELGVLGEFDGKVKYGRLLKPGEEPGDAVFREKRREDLLRRVTGWRMVRLVWADLYHPARTAALVRSVLRGAA